MSSARILREAQARARLERCLRQLERELALGTSRRHLDPLVELCELLVEETGGNLFTAAFRRELETVKRRVEARSPDVPLRLVKEPYRMIPAIPTATRCTCGDAVLVTGLPPGSAHAWQAHCERCLEPNEMMASPGYVGGYGATPQAALWDWQSKHDEAYAAQVVLVTTVDDVLAQAAAEFERQRGWCTTGGVFGPAVAAE